MPSISLLLVCDGSSDTAIEFIVDWFMKTEFPEEAYRLIVAEQVVPARGPLGPRLRTVAARYRGDLVLCHRDSEALAYDDRVKEIQHAAVDLRIPVVPVVPVRMLEAWLLADEFAIRCAANNRNGTGPLNLPRIRQLELVADPKTVLFDQLRTATGLSPSRLARFNHHRARSRVAEYVKDFSPLRTLPAFSAFENAMRTAVAALIGPQDPA